MRAACLVIALLLTACVFVPHTVVTREPGCTGVQRQMTLQKQGELYLRCDSTNQDACAAWLVAGGVVAATSLIISGSIVVAGNVVYWLERQRDCKPG